MTAGYKELMVAPNKDNRGKLTVREELLKYLTYLPFFALSLAACLFAGMLYSRYVVKKYTAVAQILVRQNVNGTSPGNSQNDLIESAMSGSTVFNVDNEMQRMRSVGLMKGVVEKNGFNISYFKLGNILKTDIYQDVPFNLVPQLIGDSDKPALITITDFQNGGGIIKYGPENKSTLVFKWNFPFTVEDKRFVLIPKYKIQTGDGNYIAKWSNPDEAARTILSDFSVDLLSQKTSIIQLSVLVENLKRGQDILNALCKEFKQSNIEDQNRITGNTISFIDERLGIVSEELKGIESSLAAYKANNQVVDIERQSEQSFQNSNNISANLTNINNQQSVVEMIRQYITSPGYQAKLVPSTLGITDVTLSNLVSHYNELQLKKEREKPLVGDNSLVLKDLNSQVNDVRVSIIENLKNISENLQLEEKNLQKQNQQYSRMIASLPGKEKVLQEIKRQLEIKQDLYVYLLQKREASAISISSTSSNFEQVDPAWGYGPVEPDTKLIQKVAVLFGLLIPIGWIYAKNLLNDKVTGIEDVQRMSEIPVIGEISHVQKSKMKGMTSGTDSRIGEEFRIIRANLSFLQKSQKEVLLVTSTNSGEGKSFVSLNLAAVLSMPDKKVALLQLDLRRNDSDGGIYPTGITDYLSGKTDDLSEIYHSKEGFPGLYIYSSGTIIHNPGDLLLSDRLPRLLDNLKKQYDHIIIDSAPLCLVGDALILGKYSDTAICVVREQYTFRKDLAYMDELFTAAKLPAMCLVLNDVKSVGGLYFSKNKKGSKYYSNGHSKKETSALNRIKSRAGI